MDNNTAQNKPDTQPGASVPAQQQTVSPLRKGMSPFKKIIYSIFGIVCFFGLLQIGMQNFFPENKPKITPISVAPEKVSWKTYANKEFKYTVSYPDYLKFSEIKYSTVFVAKDISSGSEEFPHLYISLIPDGFDKTDEVYNYMSGEAIAKFFSMKDNETYEIRSWPYAEYSTFMKLAAIPILGNDGVVIENRNVLKGEGRVNRIILVRTGKNTVLIGSYYRSQQELDTFRQFLESFKFIE